MKASQRLLQTLALAFCHLVCVHSSSAQIQNGDMGGDFASLPGDPAGGSIPSGWVSQGATEGVVGFYRGKSTENSPFTNVYANNEGSFLIQDEATSGSNNYGIYQNFSGGYGSGKAGFDFKMENLEAGYFSMQFGNNGNTEGGSGATLIRFGLNEGGYFTHRGSSVVKEVLQITAGTWYSVTFEFDMTTSLLFTGTITPFEGTAVSFSGYLVDNPAANISGVVLRDRSDIASGNVYLDNVYAIPEPATSALLVGMIGVFVATGVRKRVSALKLK